MIWLLKRKTIKFSWTINKRENNEDYENIMKKFNLEQELKESDLETQYFKFFEIYKAGVFKLILHQQG